MGRCSETVAANADGEVNGIGSWQAHHVGISTEEDRGGTTGKVGEGEGGEEGCLTAWGACCKKCGGLIVVDCSPPKLDLFAERSSQIENGAKRERRRSRSPEIIGGMK
jgi:hypothetical protein